MDSELVLGVLLILHGLLRKRFPKEAVVEELSGTEIGRGNSGQEINTCKGPEVERSSCTDLWVDYRCHWSKLILLVSSWRVAG